MDRFGCGGFGMVGFLAPPLGCALGTAEVRPLGTAEAFPSASSLFSCSDSLKSLPGGGRATDTRPKLALEVLRDISVSPPKYEHANGYVKTFIDAMAKTDVQRPSPSFSSLQDFALEKVLDVNTTLKTCAILARTKCDNLQAIIIAEKCPFVADQLVALLESAAPLDSVFQNDIYSQHLMHVGPPLDQGKFTIICPCTEKHVRKYCKQELYVIRETPEDYETITKPFIQKHQFDLKVGPVHYPHNWYSC